MAYLLVEASYIDRSVFDTHDLSVIRGGSGLLKSAIEHISNEFSYHDDDFLECIVAEATRGFFKVHGNSERVTQAVVECLNQDLLYRLCNFVVASTDCSSAEIAQKILTAEFNRRQLDSLSVVPDDASAVVYADRPCDLHGIRAGSSQSPRETINGQSVYLSESCALRLNYGRAQRIFFFENETCDGDRTSASDMLPELGTLDGLAESANYPALNKQIAILCFACSNLDAIEQAYVAAGDADKQRERQIEFNNLLKSHRRELLQQIYKQMSDPDQRIFRDSIGTDKNTGKPFMRFEPLLWGSTEMTFIVPAWQGFDLASFIFSQLNNWRIAGQALRHECGLVFCDKATPLFVGRDAVTRMAKGLVESHLHQAEHSTSAPVGRIQYLAIESENNPYEIRLYDYCQSRYGELAKHRSSLNGSINLHELRCALDMLFQTGGLAIEHLQVMTNLCLENSIAQLLRSRTQVDTQILNTPPPWLSDFESGRSAACQSLFCELEMRLMGTCVPADISKHLAALAAQLCEDPTSCLARIWFWLHLAELKKYLIPVTNEGHKWTRTE